MSATDAGSVRLLVSTIPEASAAAFVRDLVERRLIACGNIVRGVTAIYRWEGEVLQDTEAMIWLETTADRIPALRAAFDDGHPYDVPKLLELSPAQWDDVFAKWVMETTRSEDS